MAQQPAPLFTLPIPPPISSAPAPGQSAGFFTCTQPSPQVYLLSFSSPPDNRLTPAFNCTFLLALDIIEQRLPRGVVITTSSITKFYSNGLDYENAIKDPNFFVGSLYPLWRRLLTYPMPTIALINGHAFAGGLMTAMMHDYRIMNPHRGFLSLNELALNAILQPPMTAIFTTKIPMSTLRIMLLEARRYTALQALKENLLDGVGGLDETLAFIAEYKLIDMAKSEVYGKLKEELHRDVIRVIDEAGVAGEGHRRYFAEKEQERGRRDVESKGRVEEFARSGVVKAKL